MTTDDAAKAMRGVAFGATATLLSALLTLALISLYSHVRKK